MRGLVSDFLDEMYLCLKYSLRDITLFPGDNLIEACEIAAAITCVSALCTIFRIPAFVDWRGGIAGTAILLILILIGRRRASATLGDDGTSTDSIRLHESGEEGTSTEREVERCETNSIYTFTEPKA